MSIKFWGIGAEGARLTGSQKVTGSNPVFSTIKYWLPFVGFLSDFGS